jgi:hypothetical protein
MINIKFYLSIILFFSCLAIFSGCNEEDFLSENARSELTVQELYSTPEGFETAVNGMFSLARELERGMGTSNESMMGWLMNRPSDNVYAPTVTNAAKPWVVWGDLNNSTLDIYEGFFNRAYSLIRAANVIINRAEEMSWSDEDVKNETIATGRLIRAWTYRHLTYMWGDVPLITEEIQGSTFRNDWTRTPRSEIYAQMESDLLFAEENLPPVHKMAGRVNSAVAQHYLAELYLILNKPDLAEQKAQAAISNPNFRLITERYGVKANEPGVPFMDPFYDGNALYNEGNTEGLWNFPFNRNVPGGGGNRMRRGWLLWHYNIPGVSLSVENGGRGQGWYGFTKYALDLYEEGDDRASEYAIWRYLIKDDGDTVFTTTDPDKYIGQYEIGSFPPTTPDRPYNWPSTRKWDDAYEEDVSAQEGYKDQPYLRLAETYLLLAEAQFKQGKNKLAAENINIIRRRSDASEISSSDVSIEFILEERSRELFAEEQRRYTLLRLGLWLERTKMYNAQSGPYITERDILYPIPQSVIDANIDGEFPQNPGYN